MSCRFTWSIGVSKCFLRCFAPSSVHSDIGQVTIHHSLKYVSYQSLPCAAKVAFIGVFSMTSVEWAHDEWFNQ